MFKNKVKDEISQIILQFSFKRLKSDFFLKYSLYFNQKNQLINVTDEKLIMSIKISNPP